MICPAMDGLLKKHKDHHEIKGSIKKVKKKRYRKTQKL